MSLTLQKHNQAAGGIQPLCPVFGECLGCLYQNIAYDKELSIKENHLKALLKESLDISHDVYQPIVPSPKPYHYRNRLDLKLKRTKEGNVFIGFTPANKRGVLPVEACFIAQENISGFIPALKKEAITQLPPKYRVANLVVRTGDDGRVFWGGIGKRSCQLQEEDYLWTEMGGRKIFYSLDTFFQANLSILPKLFEVIRALPLWDPKPILYDLYGGVGLFSVGLIDQVEKAVLIEEHPSSLKCARYNVQYNALDHFEIIEGKVEDKLPGRWEAGPAKAHVAMVDPPRAGLSAQACELLAGTPKLNTMLYLSCNPESLARDLSRLAEKRWRVSQVTPFDFFPKTKHLEALVLLKR